MKQKRSQRLKVFKRMLEVNLDYSILNFKQAIQKLNIEQDRLNTLTQFEAEYHKKICDLKENLLQGNRIVNYYQFCEKVKNIIEHQKRVIEAHEIRVQQKRALWQDARQKYKNFSDFFSTVQHEEALNRLKTEQRQIDDKI